MQTISKKHRQIQNCKARTDFNFSGNTIVHYHLYEIPCEEFELTANSLGAHMKITESSPRIGHNELILRIFIWLTVYSQNELTVSLL